jgi:hypothetical protein
MVCACLDRWRQFAESSHGARGQSECRLLDPACGDGAFLLEVFDELRRRSGASAVPCGDRDRRAAAAFRLGIVRDHIFGVDIDPPAVEALRARLLDSIAPDDELAAEAAAVVGRNIRCGDSLTGPGWIRCQESFPEISAEKDRDIASGAIDWRRDFPAAAADGGFDIVVGNPPYLRERYAKALFDSLAATELGGQWRDARMDLWYYFVHRSLDLLRPGGILSFIVNSYWTASRGARKLISRLQRETELEEIELLGDAPVFNAVAGRHMIFRLRKRADLLDGRMSAGHRGTGNCRIVLARRSPSTRRRPIAAMADEAGPQEYNVPFDELFESGRLIVAPAASDTSLRNGRLPLSQAYATRQGMAENPPAISRRLQRQFPNLYALGEGVFVLRADEIELLNLAPVEQELLRPYYETADVGRYRLAVRPTHSVLYLTRRTAPRLDDFSNIAAHLARFRPILERRRETREGKCAWWHLHWPREEKIFLRPRVLSLQMGERPQFVFAEHPTFVGFSVNLILSGDSPSRALDVLTGVLNSNLAQSWFERHAKRRGINLEINAHVLREFPLPARDAQCDARIAQLVRARQSLPADDASAKAIEEEIEELVGALYARESADRADCKCKSGAC